MASSSDFIKADLLVKKEKMKLRKTADSGVRAEKPAMARSKKKQKHAAAAKESGKAKEKSSHGGEDKEVREDAMEPAAKEKPKQNGKNKEKEVMETSVEPAVKEKMEQKGKDKEVMEVSKEKLKGREEAAAAAESVGQQFFKIFFSKQSGERMKIPALFHQHLKEQPTGLVSLKGPSGNIWQVALTTDSEGLCFGHGWKEFVMDHSVQEGHFLVFTYDGLSQFSVTVFSSFGVIDPPALVAKPSTEIVIKIEDDDEGVQEDMDAGGSSEISILPQEEGNGVTGKRTRGVNGLLTDGNASKKHSSVAKKAEKETPGPIVRVYKDASAIVNIEKDASFSLLDESLAGNKTQIRDKNVPKIGKFIVKRARQPVVKSQRFPVTQEEKDFALRRAKEFKSKNPFAAQIMMESYVYVGFFMNIPSEFVRESLPRTCKKMILWDPLGKPWNVSYVYCSDRSAASFSGGWGKFALGNNLEKFDVCIFELFKEDNIKVHIYRVVPEITPLLRTRTKD